MAVVNKAALAEALVDRVREMAVAQYNRSDVLLNLMPKGISKGKSLQWNISVGTATGQSFTEGQVVTVFNNDTYLRASTDWKEYGDSYALTGLAIDGADANPTDSANAKLTQLRDAITRAAENLNIDLWSGDGTGAKLLGLTATGGPLDSTGTYAGKSRVTFPQWAGNRFGNGGVPRALSRSLLDQVFNTVSKAGRGQPTFAVTSHDIWTSMKGIVDQHAVLDKVEWRGETLTVGMGFGAISYNGCYFFKDAAAPAGSMVLLNEQEISIESLPVSDSRKKEGELIVEGIPLAGTPQEIMGRVPGRSGAVKASLWKLAMVGQRHDYQLVSTIAIQCLRPNAHALLVDIAA